MKIFFYLFFIVSCAFLHADGRLTNIDGQQLLYLSGEAYEIGYQHGSLLKEQVQKNVAHFIDSHAIEYASVEIKKRVADFKENLPLAISRIPKRFLEEMRGLADGAEVAYEKIVLLNLFPEMFHCTGITLDKNVTQNKELLHVRVLDYAVGKDLQQTAVVIVTSPNEGLSFINVT